ncbi:MAG: polysaccharide deacetylase family protein [Rickettsiales bacterium]|jgi:peptidoglycan/xylan/chitin deacetylase (PgdA/CDA1 family)|nr:polysaccharide deacetylase family protein [Rickettsiales bacterium]
MSKVQGKRSFARALLARFLSACFAAAPCSACAFWGSHGAGIVDRIGGDKKIYLTLDACGGKHDRKLIEFLRAEKIPATLFMTGAWIGANRKAAEELAADPLFLIQNHGAEHRPASVSGRAAYKIAGAKDEAGFRAELDGGARAVASIGACPPKWYRSGTAFYDDGALALLAASRIAAAGFAISADAGATLPPRAVYAAAVKAKGGDIILAHMNKPESGTREGLARAVVELKKRGFAFALLPKTPPGKSLRSRFRRSVRPMRRRRPCARKKLVASCPLLS